VSWSVGVDTGGTFTDLAAVDWSTGRMFVTKVPSTPADPAEAILGALGGFAERAGASLSALTMLGHGTTVATNAVLEGKGAEAALLITEGFRAVYPARAGTRPRGADLIDPAYQKAAPLVPLAATFEVPERIAFNGEVKRPLDVEAVRAIARELKARNIRTAAICFLFSFMHDAHEKQAAAIIREIHPECRLSLSCEVMPVIREFPRLSTTVLDAYVGPVVERYLQNLATRASAEGINVNRLFLMQSNGGLMRIEVAARYPNETLLSGPAAGITFAATLGRMIGEQNLVTFDMGGTSTDMGVIIDGEPATVNDGTIGGQEIGTPMVDISTLGAGGGGIARRGRDGLLKVGPESAGAAPGPACYARGGTLPTVTDANALLGYIDPTRLLGGQLVGDVELARRALSALGDELGLDAVTLAQGIRRVVNVQMAGGLRLNITDKGGDPRDFSIVAFGGAGPLHAAELARDLGVKQVIVPKHPGVSCAIGLLLSDVRHIYRQSLLTPLSRVDPADVNGRVDAMAARARDDAAREGFTEEEIVLRVQFEMRYAHQGYQLVVEAPLRLAGTADLRQVREAFDRQHEATYGVAAPGEEVELVTIRLVSTAPLQRVSLSDVDRQEGAAVQPAGSRRAFFAECGGFTDVPVYDRLDLAPGFRRDGPLIVEQLDSTTIVGGGQSMHVDDFGNLIIRASASPSSR